MRKEKQHLRLHPRKTESETAIYQDPGSLDAHKHLRAVSLGDRDLILYFICICTPPKLHGTMAAMK